jgi:type IV pilus assembly protein PilM
VAYGLGVQGLGLGGLQTSLLPPEIERVRLIRRKKPWALAASALLLLGFSALFLGDWRALAKANSAPLQTAAKEAKSTSQRGQQLQTEYNAALEQFKTKYAEGESLVADAAVTTNWAMFLKVLNEALPDPARQQGLSYDNPADRPKIEALRVHVDAIIPSGGPTWPNGSPPCPTSPRTACWPTTGSTPRRAKAGSSR